MLAANIDLVLLVCGLDRFVRAGRVQRGEALAWDAGAVPVLVLTKADLAEDLDATLAEIDSVHPGLERFLKHALSHKDVWFCRRVEIARHWREWHPHAG